MLEVGEENKCTICGNTFKYIKRNIKIADGLEEVILITEHKDCKNRLRKYNKAKEAYLNEEFNLFCLKFYHT